MAKAQDSKGPAKGSGSRRIASGQGIHPWCIRPDAGSGEGSGTVGIDLRIGCRRRLSVRFPILHSHRPRKNYYVPMPDQCRNDPGVQGSHAVGTAINGPGASRDRSRKRRPGISYCHLPRVLNSMCMVRMFKFADCIILFSDGKLSGVHLDPDDRVTLKGGRI